MDMQFSKLVGGESSTFELRLRRPFVAEELFDGEQVKGTTWILASAYGERGADGSVTGVLGCVTDIVCADSHLSSTISGDLKSAIKIVPGFIPRLLSS